MKDKASSYRPDVDGMRGVAVLAVVIYHINANLIPGGFAGVDVFFVISGFVVTVSVLRSKTDSVLEDVYRFWRRRWLRIMPALLVMIIVSSVVYLVFFPPHPIEIYQGTLRTGLTAAGGLSNFYLLRQSTDYFESDQTTNFFLHTWSLGVEEQFYIIFSFFIIAAPRLMFAQKNEKITSAVILGVLIFLSLFYFIKYSQVKPMVA